ncbi:MAG: hypothetical protein BWY42_01628 [Candidatus Omnitrophica bacterium ADurb.Bin277]|nr:MAG: hypothetical protein BWY42_01628 [Candidatus Omnitrophica bacterium ADurb.Bin277]
MEDDAFFRTGMTDFGPWTDDQNTRGRGLKAADYKLQTEE